MSSSTKPYSSVKVFIRLLALGRPYLPWYIGLCLTTLAASLLAVGFAESLRQMINGAISGDLGLLRSGLLLGLGVMLGNFITGFGSAYGGGVLNHLSVMNLQRRVVDKLARVSMVRLKEYHTGDLIARVNDSASSAQTGINDRSRALLQHMLTVSFLLIYLTRLNPGLTAASLVFAVAIPLIVTPLSRRARRFYDQRQQAQADRDAFVQDSVQGAEVVRAMSLARWFHDVLQKRQKVLLALWRRTIGFETLIQAAHFGVIIGGIVFVLGYGGLQVTRGLLDVGGLVAFLVSFERLANPIAELASVWPQLQQSISAANRVFEVLDLPDEPTGSEQSDLVPRGGDLVFEHVSFGYQEGQVVLRDVSFQAKEGQVTAFVGPSGCGKSTLLNLVLRFYAPAAGRILYDGVPIEKYDLQAWRRAIAYVSQAPILFSGTLRDNIAYGRPGATDQEVEAAARAACIHDFISRTPDGYNTRIGERGLTLSGGERQRLAIARAVLRDPAILILDEPTSSLDSENEALVQQALGRLMAGRTTLVVAHRLSTIRDADLIVVLEGGAIREMGTHVDLMALGGRYRAMYEADEASGQTLPPSAEVSL